MFYNVVHKYKSIVSTEYDNVYKVVTGGFDGIIMVRRNTE